MTPGQRRPGRRARRRRLVPRAAPDPRRVPVQAAAAVRPRQRGRRVVARSAPAGAARAARATGSPRSACPGGFAEVAVAPAYFSFRCPTGSTSRQGAALVLNYHTAYFALRSSAAACEPGETVLVHGAAGGVGTAALQVAKGLGARTIAVVSTDAKERSRRGAGADHVLRSDGPWKDQAKELRRRRRRRDRPGRRRPLHRQPALAARGRPGGRRRLHRRLDPGGPGQPPAAQQHRGGRRRLGTLGTCSSRRRGARRRSARRSTS